MFVVYKKYNQTNKDNPINGIKDINNFSVIITCFVIKSSMSIVYFSFSNTFSCPFIKQFTCVYNFFIYFFIVLLLIFSLFYHFTVNKVVVNQIIQFLIKFTCFCV